MAPVKLFFPSRSSKVEAVPRHSHIQHKNEHEPSNGTLGAAQGSSHFGPEALPFQFRAVIRLGGGMVPERLQLMQDHCSLKAAEGC